MSFKAMQRDLRERGLIDEGNRLTDAGNAYVDQLIALLRAGELPAPKKRLKSPRVKWASVAGPRPTTGVEQQHSELAI